MQVSFAFIDLRCYFKIQSVGRNWRF